MPDHAIESLSKLHFGFPEERAAAVHGLPLGTTATNDEIRRALTGIGQTLHLALDPEHLEDTELNRALLQQFEAVATSTGRSSGKVYRAWNMAAPVDEQPWQVNLFQVGKTTINQAMSVDEQGSVVYRNGMQLNLAVAVIHDPAGGILVVDHLLNTVGVIPALFRGGDKLRSALISAVAHLPQLNVAHAPLSQQAIAQHIKAPKLKSRLKWGIWLIVVLLAGGIGGYAIFKDHSTPTPQSDVSAPQDSDPIDGSAAEDNAAPDVPGLSEAEFGKTFTLANNAQLTVGKPEISSGTANNTIEFSVQFCASDAAADSAHQISAFEFNFEDAGIRFMSATASHDALTSVQDLAAGDCASSQLAFSSMTEIDAGTLTYTNIDGQEVAWEVK